MPERDFDSIYRNFSRLVYWTAFGVVHNREQAEDIMQNVFLNALRHLDTLAGFNDSQLKSWLYRTAINAALDSKRRVKHEMLSDEPIAVNVADATTDVEAAAERRLNSSTVVSAMERIDAKYREVLTLHYFSNMSHADIAEALKITVGTVKSRLARGRTQLARVLSKEGFEYDG